MTAADLKEHQHIIDQLKALTKSAEFEPLFLQLTADLAKSKQFLLKMELKRLAQPCDFFIDLRGHVDGEVRPYNYRDKTHYMDDQAVRLFETGIAQFGQYTLGVYEEVMNADNNFRVMHRKETAQRLQSVLQKNTLTTTASEPEPETSADNNDGIKLIQFGHYISRREERMNFGIDVEVRFDNNRFMASTSDLSVSGCKLKIPKGREAEVGQHINIAFKGLEQEFTLELAHGVDYQLLDIEQQDKFSYWRLKRLADDQEQQFSRFLQQFIHGNKRRYKVNLDNATDAVITKGYEQFFLPHINCLPVFFNLMDKVVTARFALTTDYNKHIWHYFLDEQQQPVLPALLTAKRLNQLLKQDTEQKSALLYTFTHAAKGKLYFYSATNIELEESLALRQLFFGFGAGKNSFRVFQLCLLRTSDQDATQHYAIPAGAHQQSEVATRPPPLIQGIIKTLRFIVSLTDISQQHSSFWYQQYTYAPEQLRELNQFACRRAAITAPCEAIPVHYVNLRAESRYLYKTSISIEQGADLPSIQGFSRDFSAGGLQIETEQAVTFSKGQRVLLALPDLQKITNKFQLQQLPYEVMAVSKSKTIMNLRVPPTEQSHPGRLFFQQLIQSNRAKLTLAEETPKYPGMSEALRNMYLKVQNSFAFYVHRKGIRYDVNVVGRGLQLNLLHRLLSLPQGQADTLQLEPLLQNNAANLQFASQLKNMKRFDAPYSYELYMRLSAGSVDPAKLSSHYDYEFNTEQDKQDFIRQALQQDLLFAFKIFLSRTGRLDADYITKELNYISIYAIHKAKSLEEELWSVAGVGEVLDISAEIPLRFGIELTAEQQKRQKQFLLQVSQPVS